MLGGDGAPDSSEIRFERFQKMSRLRNEASKRFFSSRSIAERYVDEEIDIHFHLGLADGIVCAFCHPWKSEKANITGSEDCKSCSALLIGQMDVLVGIREVPENPRPIASVVRLQGLDSCNVGLIEALEPSTGLPPQEALFRVLYRELGTLDWLARTKGGEFVNQIIKSGPEIVANLSCKDALIKWDKIRLRNLERFLLGLRIHLYDNVIKLDLPECSDSINKITKVFACPVGSGECSIQRMNRHGPENYRGRNS